MSASRWNNKDSGNLSSPSLLADASSGETVLSRNISQENLRTTPIQNQIDGLVSGFVDQATDWKSIAAMTAGGLAYRWGKISVLGVGAIRESPLLARPLAIAFGLGSEVTAFEFTQRTLTFLSSPLTPHPSPNLWSWSGPGGWKEGILNSLITFGTLKGFGTLSQGQNIILQHGFQDAGMVLGHQLVSLAGIGPKPEGSLAEQLVHAEVTNLQIGAGMGLGHALTGGRILALEKSLDLSIGQIPPTPLFSARGGSATLFGGQRGAKTNFAMAMEGPPDLNSVEGTDLQPPSRLISPIHMMSSTGSGGSLSPSYKDQIQERASKLPKLSLSQVEENLKKEWETWEDKKAIPSSEHPRFEALLTHYARYALAHLGRETPRQLPFIQEIYEMAAASHLAEMGEQIPGGDRFRLIRFLSTQAGRRGREIFSKEKSSEDWIPPPLTVAETRRLLGETDATWVDFLRKETDLTPVSPLEKARIYHRGLSLMHFYTSYVYGKLASSTPLKFHEIPFQGDLLRQVFKDTLRHPYPIRSLEIFERFFQKELGQSGVEILEAKAPVDPGEDPRQPFQEDPLSAYLPPFEMPEENETWAEYLKRIGVSKGELDVAELGIRGVTVMKWGSELDKDGRIAPPGDILGLLGVIILVNSSSSHGIDPLEAIRLTLPEQLSDFVGDNESQVIIRFPDLLRNLNYENFSVGALLRAFLATRPEARDVDLARQWEVSEATVGAYRRGEIHKMQMKTLEKLVESLAEDSVDRREMKKLLMFLRYRPYFDATIPVFDQDGTPLNRTPPQPSRTRILLIPKEGGLRSLDINRRIQFEREPFASAIDGTVDLALELMEQRAIELELFGEGTILSPEGLLDLTGLRRRIQLFRDGHIKYFQTLSHQEQNPEIIHPGELREIRDFYRDFFKFFEGIYLHAKPKGRLKVEGGYLDYEVVPPTPEHPQGVKIRTATTSPHRPVAFAVVEDLFHDPSPPHPELLRGVLYLRILKYHLKAKNLHLEGAEHKDSNEQLLKKYLEETGISEDVSEIFEEFSKRESAVLQENLIILDPKLEAVLHRIKRGRLTHGNGERRQLQWEADLYHFILKEKIASLKGPMGDAFQAYLKMVPKPFQSFEADRLADALAPLRDREGNEVADQVRELLIKFMKELGLPTQVGEGTGSGRLTADGLAGAAFATYISRFRSHHPLRPHGELLIDPTLLERVVEDRLVDFPYLNRQRDKVILKVKDLIEDYNRRTPPLKVLEIKASTEALGEPFLTGTLRSLFEQEQGQFLTRHPEAYGKVDPRLIFGALGEMKKALSEGKILAFSEIKEALNTSFHRLKGIRMDQVDLQINLRFLSQFVQALQLRQQTFSRLALEIPGFVHRKGYHSELDNPKRLGQEIEELFQAYIASALLDTSPINFREAIYGVLGNRFDAYPTIHEDVVRGMQVIFHQLMDHYRENYSGLKEGFDLSLEEAKQHGEVEKFWEAWVAWASAMDPSIKDTETLRQKIGDLEQLLALTPHPPKERLSELIDAALEEIKNRPKPPSSSNPPSEPPTSPPPPSHGSGSISLHEVEEFLKLPIPDKILEKYPELSLMEDEIHPTWIPQLTEGRVDLIQPEGRTLIQLLAMIRKFSSHIPAEGVESIQLEVQTAPPSESLEKLTERVLRVYEKYREDFLRQGPEAALVGTFPEIRGSNKPIQDLTELIRALNRVLSERRLPKDLEEDYLRILPKVLLPKEKQSQNNGLALRFPRFYLKNRRRILESPLRPIEEDLTLPMALGTAPNSLRYKLEREAPELDLIPDEAIFERLVRNPGGSNEMYSFYSQKGAYLLNKISLLIGGFEGSDMFDSKRKEITAKIMEEADPFFFTLPTMGASHPHLAAWATERLWQAYQKQRPTILKQLIKTMGIEKVLSAFPEIRREEMPRIPIIPGKTNPLLSPPPDFETAAKILQILNRGIALPHHRRALEKILEKVPIKVKGDKAELTQEDWKPALEKLMEYYLDNRKEFLNLPKKLNPLDLEAIAREDEKLLEPFWELQALTLEGIKEDQKAIEHILEDLKYPPESNQIREVFVFFNRKDGGLATQIMTEKEGEEAMKRLDEGLPVQLRRYPGTDFFPKDFHEVTPVTPETLFQTSFGSWISLPLYRLSAWANLHPPFYQESLAHRTRASILLLFGADPQWVLESYRDKLIKIYEKYRNEIIRSKDFSQTVAQLTEIQSVPDYALEQIIKFHIGTGTEPQRARDSKNDLFFRIASLFSQESVPKKIKDHFKKLKGTDYRWSTGQLPYYALARFYLEHRQEILPHLKPWPEVPEDPVSLVAQLPEIQDVPDHVVQRNIKKTIDKTGTSSQANNPDHDLAHRLGAIFEQQSLPKELIKRWHQLADENIQSGLDQFYRVLCRFYLAHRQEILPHLKPWPEAAPATLDSLGTFKTSEINSYKPEEVADHPDEKLIEIGESLPELRAITDEEIIAKRTGPQEEEHLRVRSDREAFAHLEKRNPQEYRLYMVFARIFDFIDSQQDLPPVFKKKWEVLLKWKTETGSMFEDQAMVHQVFNRKVIKIYLEYREEILKSLEDGETN